MAAIARKLATLARTVRRGGVTEVLRVAATQGAPRIPGAAHAVRLAIAASVAPQALAARLRHGAPTLVLGFFGGIGDELLLTCVVRELRRRGRHGTWVITEHPELWEADRGRDVFLRWDERARTFADVVRWPAVFPYYCHYDAAEDRDVPIPPRHILRLMCEQAGIVGPIARRPWLTLRPDEWERGARVPDQVAIQSGGLSARFPARTKQWFPDRYQAVVDARRGDVNFVQVGAAEDPPLDGVLDLRGRTTVRETAAVLARSQAFVGQVGMLMHLARAVDCRAVVAYGGRETPAQSGYGCNENLYVPVPCSPCWRVNTCPYDVACLREVHAADAVAALDRQLARAGQPLAVDVDAIPADAFPRRVTPDGRTLVAVPNVYGVPREVEAALAA